MISGWGRLVRHSLMPQLSPVFPIEVSNSRLRKAAAGNAILINRENGVFVTCAHVADPWEDYRKTDHYIYVPHEERFQKAEASKHWFNRDAGLAYLRLPGNFLGYPPVKIRITNAIEQEEIRVIGCNYPDKSSSERTGIILNLGVACTDLNFIYKDYIQYRAQGGGRGWSGSAVVDAEDRLVGVHSMGGRTQLAIPASEIDSSICFPTRLMPVRSTLPLFLQSLTGKVWHSRPS
jgi:S1-C subfamily serine protease